MQHDNLNSPGANCSSASKLKLKGRLGSGSKLGGGKPALARVCGTGLKVAGDTCPFANLILDLQVCTHLQVLDVDLQ